MLSYHYADSNFPKGAKTAPIMGFFMKKTVIFLLFFLHIYCFCCIFAPKIPKITWKKKN